MKEGIKVIKGHTKIELANKKTGQKKTIESDNLVTNAMYYLVQQTPWTMGLQRVPYGGDSTIPIVDTYFGGLLCFEKTLEENADNVLFPNNNQMVANARARYAAATLVPEFGAYNAEESSFTLQNNMATRKYVYDFGTAKANGQISAIALTNYIAGAVGAGNSSGQSDTTIYSKNTNIKNYLQTNNYDISINYRNIIAPEDMKLNITSELYPLFIDYKNNFVALVQDFKSDSGTITIYKGHVPISAISPMATINNSQNITIYDTVDIAIPEGVDSFTYWDSCAVQDGVYIIMPFTRQNTEYQVLPNDNIYIWYISKDFNTTKFYQVKNTTGVDLKVGDGRNVERNHRIIINNKYLYAFNSEGGKALRAFKINIEDPTDVTELEWAGEALKDNRCCFCSLDDSFIIINRYASDVTYQVNLETNKINTFNIAPTLGNDSFSSKAHWEISPVCGNKGLYWCRVSPDYINILPNPFLLSTINNLPEPINKTSDMSMKITYTLTGEIEPTPPANPEGTGGENNV